MKKILFSLLGLGILFFWGSQLFAAPIIYTHSVGNGFTFSQDTDFSYISYGSKIIYSEKNETISASCFESMNDFTINLWKTKTEITLLEKFNQSVEHQNMSKYDAGIAMKETDLKTYGRLSHRACWLSSMKIQSLGKNWYSILYPPYEGSSYALYNIRYGKYYEFGIIPTSIVQVKIGVTGVYVFYGDGERGEQGIALLTNDGKIIEQPLLMSNNEVLRSFDLLTRKRIQLNLLTNTSYSPEWELLWKSEKRIIKVQF